MFRHPGEFTLLLLLLLAWSFETQASAEPHRIRRSARVLSDPNPSPLSAEPAPDVLTSCDFNSDSAPFCQFRQDSSDQGDWTRHRGPTPTEGTGPSGDFPDGGE
ncbi:hypothetical protein AOXY_G38034 [Acipenser oxyrinchus oxyrinchus]|uniref:MAM domain-containing protein n=1 Tax=Acipenser oxyrinchus oxyrinchus TaxID=40147 RepID=A0AAD8CFM7_ACIOX|nr:hypothetical protein AOXY_G38034 [Acipenser oxyrinchus oxyrinchus]